MTFWLHVFFSTNLFLAFLLYWPEKDVIEERNKVPRDLSDLAGEGNIENMLIVDKGLHELASLKVLILELSSSLNLHGYFS